MQLVSFLSRRPEVKVLRSKPPEDPDPRPQEPSCPPSSKVLLRDSSSCGSLLHWDVHHIQTEALHRAPEATTGWPGPT